MKTPKTWIQMMGRVEVKKSLIWAVTNQTAALRAGNTVLAAQWGATAEQFAAELNASR